MARTDVPPFSAEQASLIRTAGTTASKDMVKFTELKAGAAFMDVSRYFQVYLDMLKNKPAPLIKLKYVEREGSLAVMMNDHICRERASGMFYGVFRSRRPSLNYHR